MSGAVSWSGTLEDAGELVSDGDAARYVAAEDPGAATIVVRASNAGVEAQARLVVELLADLAGQDRASGIPDPIAVQARGERWHSRLRECRLEFNAAHGNYEAVADSPTRRLRYLVTLFAKETVLRNFHGADDAAPLERLVEVLTHLDKYFASRGERVVAVLGREVVTSRAPRGVASATRARTPTWNKPARPMTFSSSARWNSSARPSTATRSSC